MKVFCCFAVLFLAAVCQSRVVDIDEDDLQELKEESTKFRKLLQNKCEKAGHPFTDEEYEESIQKARTCLEPHFPKDKDGFKSLQDVTPAACKETQVIIRKCLDDIVHGIEKCLPEEEKFFPDFVLSGFNGIFDLLCEDNDEAWDEIFSEDSFKCIENIMENIDKVDDCKEKFIVFKAETTEDDILKKEDLCHDLTSSNKCIHEFLTAHCPSNKIFHKVTDAVHKAITTPCA